MTDSKILRGPQLGRAVPNLPLRDIILRNIANKPHTLFMIEDGSGREWTYGELGEAAWRVADWLYSRGLGPGCVASLCSAPTFDMFAFTLGAWIQGLTTHPLDPHLTKEEALGLMKVSGPSVVYWGWEGGREAFGGGGLEVVGPSLFELEAETPPGPRRPLPRLSHDHVQTIVFSSGTTSHPKAVMVRDRALNIMSALFEMETEGLQRILVTGMPFWTSFTVIVNYCLKNCKTMVVPRNISDYKDIYRVIRQYKPQFWLAPPHILLSMAKLDYPHADTSSLVNVHTTGFSLSVEQRTVIRERVVGVGVKHWYASSEAGNITYWPHAPSDSTDSVGKVCPTAQLKVVDCSTGGLLGPDSPGELWVRTETMMAGYIGAKAELDSQGWFRTGDIGYYDKNHYVYFLSRQRDIIRYLWLKILPWELEAVLCSHPEVVECCVVRRPHSTDGEHPAAFVVTSPPHCLTETQLHLYFKDRVSETKQLRGGVFFVKSLPKGPTGKVLRKQLEAVLAKLDEEDDLIS